jgi:hypothetical protein
MISQVATEAITLAKMERPKLHPYEVCSDLDLQVSSKLARQRFLADLMLCALWRSICKLLISFIAVC